jgi:hypothetical protein
MNSILKNLNPEFALKLYKIWNKKERCTPHWSSVYSPEDEDSMFLQNTGTSPQVNKALQPRRTAAHVGVLMISHLRCANLYPLLLQWSVTQNHRLWTIKDQR